MAVVLHLDRPRSSLGHRATSEPDCLARSGAEASGSGPCLRRALYVAASIANKFELWDFWRGGRAQNFLVVLPRDITCFRTEFPALSLEWEYPELYRAVSAPNKNFWERPAPQYKLSVLWVFRGVAYLAKHLHVFTNQSQRRIDANGDFVVSVKKFRRSTAVAFPSLSYDLSEKIGYGVSSVSLDASFPERMSISDVPTRLGFIETLDRAESYSTSDLILSKIRATSLARLFRSYLRLAGRRGRDRSLAFMRTKQPLRKYMAVSPGEYGAAGEACERPDTILTNQALTYHPGYLRRVHAW